jgi:hypothetical protein
MKVLKTTILAVVVVALFPVFTATTCAVGCATPDFLEDFPANEELNWSENIQGVAHDEGHWFFTNQDSLIKLPSDSTCTWTRISTTRRPTCAAASLGTPPIRI